MSTFQYLTLEIAEKIAIVGLNNPPGNSLKMPLLQELDRMMDELHANPEVKVIVITGAGKTFASGADIEEISKLTSQQQAKEMSAFGQKVFLKIENGPKPVIAAINGFCLGGGLELAMSCHMRVASDRSFMGLPEITLGIIPGFGGTQRLPRIVGLSKASQMILSGDQVRSEEALAIGLVNMVVSKDTLLDDVKKLAAKMTSKSAVAIKQALKSMKQGASLEMAASMEVESSCFAELYNSADMKEGVSAFLEKRKPNFQDR
ncbi:enoyl-CoA hydratase-related protein [bacterium]|nr:enoyl-CoA hydratase-related protein [bacterium]NUN46442.1 enoyl-CoA hydratase/isomerase family protein [bacterium]